jgi:hypothetical protein
MEDKRRLILRPRLTGNLAGNRQFLGLMGIEE